MDKTKIGVVAGLAVLIGLTLLQRLQDPPAPSEGDHDDDHPAQTSPAKVDPALSGGITTMKYVDTKVGTGPAAKIGDHLTMNYTGKLLNGTVFDTSIGKSPFQFTVGEGQVIKGWDQGIPGMKVGGKRHLTIPASLGYGNQAQAKIPAGATLVFDVELLSIGK